MKCPYCDKEMENGFIQGAKGVFFSPDQKFLWIWKNPWNKKDVKITDTMWETSSPACYCYDCECLIWKKASDETPNA